MLARSLTTPLSLSLGKIRILPDHLASQIAAGEVVERPASVVKELVENSLDSGAARVDVDLEHGGKRRIRVRDDGSGMGENDALLAFDRHATSKIGSFEDLEAVSTFGFRGEALSSIAAVARVRLETAENPGDGVRVRIDGGRVLGVDPVSRGRGTEVEVASLFFNVPARRRFLKTTTTELRRSSEVVQGYALARPDAGFSLRHGGRTLIDAPPSGDGRLPGLKRRIAAVFGEPLAKELHAIDDCAIAAGGMAWGYVGSPKTSRGRRLFTFVNRRLVRDRAILATFYRAVREEWRSDEFPSLFLFLDLPAEGVDVNVHPQKAEVRFRDHGVIRSLEGVLRSRLQEALGVGDAPELRGGSASASQLPWTGLGERGSAFPGYGHADRVAEPGRIAEVAYAPVERAPVRLTGRDGQDRSMRLLGQYKGTLILLEGPDGLYVIDQHVAHERVLYERLRQQFDQAAPERQNLLEPQLLELGPSERLRIRELSKGLEGCGFELSELSGGTVGVSAIPALLTLEEGLRILEGLATDGGDGSAESVAERLLDQWCADHSCRAAVKMHEPLSASEMEELIDELFRAEQPYACPHGRPIILKMTDADLERRFGRS